MAQHLFGIQQDEKVRALAVRLAVGGWWGGQQPTRTAGLSSTFVFLFRAAITPQSRPTFFMLTRRVMGVMSHHQRLLPFALLCFFAHAKKEHVKFCSLFLFASVTVHRLLWVFFFVVFFLTAAARCAVREEDQSRLLVAFALPHPTAPANLQRAD